MNEIFCKIYAYNHRKKFLKLTRHWRQAGVWNSSNLPILICHNISTIQRLHKNKLKHWFLLYNLLWMIYFYVERMIHARIVGFVMKKVGREKGFRRLTEPPKAPRTWASMFTSVLANLLVVAHRWSSMLGVAQTIEHVHRCRTVLFGAVTIWLYLCEQNGS